MNTFESQPHAVQANNKPPDYRNAHISRAPADGKPPHGWLLPPVFDANTAMESQNLNTDLDASLRFAEWQQKNLRYCPGLGWLAWDGKRWALDGEGRALELAKESARAWTKSCTEDCSVNDREKRIKAALNLEFAQHIKAILELAKVDLRLVRPSDGFDCDPWLLNVNNGTLDLKSGELRPHRREDFITKMAPVEYDASARHPALERLLSPLEITCCPGMVAFLARCFGCALTGDASAETLFLLQGEGGAGKTTLIEALSALLGDYAVKLTFESFCLSHHGRSPGGASPDLIKLRGARLAYASEGDQSAHLDAGVVKTLTGGEPVTARALYSAPITFPQTWNLWLVSNFAPQCDAQDTGLWRRLLKIRLPSVPPGKRDPALKSALISDPAAQSALLAWCVRGCRDWQERGGGRIGLAPPEQIEALTSEYRAAQDTTGQWWSEFLGNSACLDPNASTPNENLRKNYETWCEKNGSQPLGIKRFAGFLESQRLVRTRSNGERRWRGIKLGPPR